MIGLSFGCPLEGPIPEERVLEIAGRLASLGYAEVSIADSIGVANPGQVRRLMRRLQEEFPGVHFSLHLHNTRGLGLANVLAGLEEGVDTFDSALGGLGGSAVVVPGAGGNVPTEDLLNMLHEMSIETGVDLGRVMAASRRVEEILQRPLPSYVLSAGTKEDHFRRGRELAGAKSEGR